MKKHLILPLLLITTSLFSVELSPEVETFNPTDLKLPEMDTNPNNVHFILYGQSLLFGVGMGIRTQPQGKSLGLEVDVGVNPFGFRGSVGPIKYFGNPETPLYLTTGIGGGLSFEGTSAPFVPVYLGMQRKSFFVDIGTDVIFVGDSWLLPSVLPVPSLRAGLVF